MGGSLGKTVGMVAGMRPGDIVQQIGPPATESLLGTLLWGLFVVAFSRKVIR